MSRSDARWAQMEWISDSFDSCAMISQVVDACLRATPLIKAPPLFYQNYFSQVPSLFVHEAKNRSALYAIPLCMARDGSRTLRRRGVWSPRFSPMIATSDAIVHPNAELVYRTVARLKFSQTHLPKSFLIAGWGEAGFSSPDLLIRNLRALVSRFGSRNISRIPLSIYFEESGKKSRKNSSLTEFAISSARKTGFKKMDVLSARDLLPYGSTDGVCYVEVNAYELIADTYLKHQVLSQGGGLLEAGADRKMNSIFRFDHSPFHSFEIGRRR